MKSDSFCLHSARPGRLVLPTGTIIAVATIALFMGIMFFFPIIASAQKSVRIGVLANLGKETARRMWSPTADYLTATIPGHTVTIVPLDFEEINGAVKQRQVDFVLANPGIYVELEHDHGVARIATLDTLWEGAAYNLFGGVIFTRPERDDIAGLRDLKGKTFMAVHETSYGGWYAAWRELRAAGVYPARHFSRLLFTGENQERVVFGVLNNEADAGTVRTGILERLIKEGRVNPGDFKILHPQKVPGFPLLLSTRLYPEWAFARLRDTSDELAKKTAAALLNMPASASAAQAGGIAGFTVPCDYQPIHELMQELRLGAYKEYGKVTLGVFVRQYRYWIAVVLVLIAAAASLMFRYEEKIRRARNELEERVIARTAELVKANTQIKASERYNRALFESSIIGLALAKMDGSLVDVNEAYARIIGRTVEETLALSYCDITPVKYAFQERQRLESLRKTGRYGPYEKEYVHKDGRLVPVRLLGVLIEKDGEQLIWSSVEDVTDRRQAEDALRNYQERLEELVAERTRSIEEKTEELEKSQQALKNLLEDVNKAKQELEISNQKLKELDRLKSMFIASMSHELRTPLNSIIGFSSILLQGMSGEINEEQRDHLGRVFRSGKHLLALITDVIDIAKIESGKIDPYPEDFELHALIDEAVGQVQRQAGEKGLAIAQQLPDGPVTIHSDRKRLLQCLLNYLSNAVKFTETGTVTVAVKLLRRGAEEERVEFSVSDTGIGISASDQKLLFGSFVRFESHLKTVTPGTGLGLYLTRKLAAEVLAGEVGMESREGKGSRFWLRVPAVLRNNKA